jgi:hypothetical protein
MGTNILPTYHDSSSITASSLTDWLSLGDLENLDAPYTETGYLEFPMALVKQYGPASRTLAAFASLESVQRYNVTQQRLEDVSRLGCLPLDTLKKHKAQLERLGAIRAEGRAFRGPARTRISSEVMHHYGKQAKDRLQIPRRWFVDYGDFGFTVLLLWAFYRYTCRVTFSRKSYCVFSFAEIADKLGFSERTWRDAAKFLAQRGLIERQKLANGNYAVWIPNQKPAHEPGTTPDDLATPQARIVCRASALVKARFGNSPLPLETDVRHAGKLIELWAGEREAKRMLAVIVDSWEVFSDQPPDLAALVAASASMIGRPPAEMALLAEHPPAKMAPVYKEGISINR